MSNQQKKLEFTGYLNQVHPRLFAYVHALVKDLHDADDIVQRTSLILWEKFDTFDRGQSFFAWAAGVARFEALNFVRKRGRDKLCFREDIAALLAESTDSQRDDLESQSAALAECLQKLPPAQQTLIEACYTSGRSVEEVARGLQRTTHSVYNSLRRARQWLWECVRRAALAEGY